MSEQSEATELTRESLFPDGWDKPKQPEAAPEEIAEEAVSEDSAEAQVDDEQAGEEEAAEALSEGGIGKMSLPEFLKAAGVTMEEFYRDVYREEDGKEVSMSEAWDERARLKDAHEALLRERNELQERVNQSQASVPQPGMSPEAQQLLMQAQAYHNALLNNDWSGMDPGQEAKAKMDLQLAVQSLHQQAQQKQGEWEQKQAGEIAKARAEADRQTRSRIPEWSDAKVMQSEWRHIGDVLSRYGLQQAEIDSIVDPRIKHMLRDAWKAMTDNARVKERAKTVRKVSKTIGSGARAPDKGKPNLKQVKQHISEQSSREARQKARLTVDLG